MTSTPRVDASTLKTPVVSTTDYVASVKQDPALRALGLDFSKGSPTPIDTRMMRKILNLAVVKANFVRFVSDVMLDSDLIFKPGREAKMDVMAALGRVGAKAIAERFVNVFSDRDDPTYLGMAYEAAAEGTKVPTYFELEEARLRFDFSTARALSAPQLDTLIESMPHLQALSSAGWDLVAIAARRPGLFQALTPASVAAMAGVQLAMAYFDYPESTLRSGAEEAAVKGYQGVFVAPNSAQIMQAALAGTGIKVETE